MPKARILISSACFLPATLKMLGEVFDEVWASVAAEFEHDDVEDARIRLATIILDLAKDEQLGSGQIARTASRLILQTKLTATYSG